MADVYVRFRDDPVYRTMYNEEQGVGIDLTADGEMIGVELIGAKSVTIDGEDIGRRADTWELAALAAISERLDKETAAVLGARMREIVYGPKTREKSA